MRHAFAPVYEPSFRTARSPASYRNPAPALSDKERPLVIDLEGALLNRSLLAEGISQLLRQNPLMIFAMLFWYIQGRMVLKRNVMARVPMNLARLSVNKEFLNYIHAQSSLGREVVLAATVSELSATQLLRRFPVFNRAILFDETLETFGAKRAERLLACFTRGFHYAGSSMSDHPVWAATDHIILVNPSAKVGRAARMQGRAITQFPQASTAAAGSVIANRPSPDEKAMIRQGVSIALLASCVSLVAAQILFPESTSMLLVSAKFAGPLIVAACLGNLLAKRAK